MKKLFLSILMALAIAAPAFAGNVLYVRPDGGPGGNDSTHCNGSANVAFTGSNGPNCAFNHPNWPLPGAGQPTTYKAASGDTVVIGTGSYRMGCPTDTGNCTYADWNYTATAQCYSAWTYNCGGIDPPDGTAGDWTEIVGCTTSGCADRADYPELYLVGRMDTLFNLGGASYIYFQDFEVTDHWGADGECSHGNPVQSCGRSFAATGAGSDWHDITLDGMDIHGLTQACLGKFGGPGAGGTNANWTFVDTSLDGCKSAGIDMDGCGNNGTCGITGDISFTRVNMRWNGCSEAYPVVWGPDGAYGKVGRLPTVESCREGNNGGYGDMIGSSHTGGTWTFLDSNFSHNSSDAIDLLYCGRNDRAAYGDCSMVIKRTRFEGNNSQAIKGPDLYLEDNIVIGNCSFFGNSAVDYTAPGFSPCRAAGTPLAIQHRANPAEETMIFNNTIFGNGDVIFQIDDAGAGSCDMQLKNNIIYGAYDYHGFDATAMFYSASCSTINRDEDYNLCYGVFKTAYKDCDGANSMDNTTDPLLTGAPIPIGFSGDSTTGYYTGTDFMEEFYLSASSPARDVADESITADGADAYDVNQFDRGASWDLGGYEYGTTEGEGGSECGNNTTEAPEVCDGTDLNGYNCTTVPGSTWDGGTLACLSNCTNYDTSACTSTPNCGNGSIDPGEDCDTSGPLLNGETCASQGYSADPADDNLACTAGTCLYDYSGCAAIACQDGYEEGSEQCDDGNATEGDGCSSACEDENANYELFRTYTETDPNSRIAVTVHKSAVAAITRNESAKLQSDQGAGNIGDFVIDYTLTQDDCVDSTGGAAIAYDAGTNYTIDNSSTATFSHTVGTGSNRLLIVSIAREEFGTNRSVTGVTYNSVAMTFAASANHSNGNNKVSTYYLLAPDSGANNVEVTFSGQVGAIAVTADSYENILQQAPEVTGNTEDAAINFNTLTDGSIALNSLVGSISSATLSTTDNELHNFANTGDLVMGVSSKESNAGADSMAWSVSTGVYASTIVVFAPQGTGGDNPAITGVIGISSSAHADIKAQETAGDGIFLYLSCRSSASNNTWNLVTVDSGTSSDTYLDAFYNGTRYGQLERSGTTLTNKVYTDMARTNLLDTQTVTTTATAHRYLTITPTYNDSVTGTSFSGSVYDVDLTATGSPASPATKSFEINGVTIDGSGFP